MLDEDCSSLTATEEELDVITPACDGAAAQVFRPLAVAGFASPATIHAAPAPAATAYISHWKPAITQAWINQS